MNICSYGCGKEGKYKLKCGKFSCSDHFTRCPEYRKNESKRMIKQNKLLQESLPYEQKNYPNRKEILWNDQKQKCNRCSYNLYNLHSGPYQIHHIDGNFNNLSRENEELLCCNCHFMTDNYGFKGRKHHSKTKQIIGEKSIGRKVPNLYVKAAVS